MNTSTPDHAPKLLDQLRNRIRLKHYSLRTEQAYLQWVKRYILFHGKRHPSDLGKEEIEAFTGAEVDSPDREHVIFFEIYSASWPGTIRTCTVARPIPRGFP